MFPTASQPERARKYHFDPALHEALRAAYCGSKSQITSALDKLMRRRPTWPRHAFTYEAGRLGLETTGRRRDWTPAETAYLEESCGKISVRAMAEHLHRSHCSVASRAADLHLSRRISEGYSIQDLSAVFGEGRDKIRHWMERGLLGQVHYNADQNGHRVTHANVRAFIRHYSAEYDLRRVDQSWYKMTLFEDGHGDQRWL